MASSSKSTTKDDETGSFIRKTLHYKHSVVKSIRRHIANLRDNNDIPHHDDTLGTRIYRHRRTILKVLLLLIAFYLAHILGAFRGARICGGKNSCNCQGTFDFILKHKGPSIY